MRFWLVLLVATFVTAQVFEFEETDVVNLSPNVTDPDGDLVTSTFGPPLDESGVWQTTYGDAGVYEVVVVSSDGVANTSQVVTVVVEKKLEPPEIQLLSEGEVRSREGKPINFLVDVTDVNDDELQYEWMLDGEVVSNEQQWIWKPGFTMEGLHTVTLVVVDGDGLSDTVSWSVDVVDVRREALLENIPSVRVIEGERVVLQLPDFAAVGLGYSISDPVGDDNIWQTSFADAGEYSVMVTAFDKEESFSKEVKVLVQNLDRPPVVKSVPLQVVNEGETVEVRLNVSDPDEDPVAVEIIEPFEGLALDGLLLRYTPGYDVVSRAGILPALVIQRVKLVARAGDIEVKSTVLIKVRNVNRPPVVERFEDIVVEEGERLTFNMSASDPDGDRLWFDFDGIEEGIIGFDAAGVHIVRGRVSDGSDRVERVAKVTVVDKNRPPVIKVNPPDTSEEGVPLVMQVVVTDPDNNPVDVQVEDAPQGVVFDGRVLRWENPRGENVSFAFVASDGLVSTKKELSVVLNPGRPPVMISPASGAVVSMNVNVPLEVQVDGNVTWKLGLFESVEGKRIVRRFTSPGEKTMKIIVDGYPIAYTLFVI